MLPFEIEAIPDMPGVVAFKLHQPPVKADAGIIATPQKEPTRHLYLTQALYGEEHRQNAKKGLQEVQPGFLLDEHRSKILDYAVGGDDCQTNYSPMTLQISGGPPGKCQMFRLEYIAHRSHSCLAIQSVFGKCWSHNTTNTNNNNDKVVITQSPYKEGDLEWFEFVEQCYHEKKSPQEEQEEQDWELMRWLYVEGEGDKYVKVTLQDKTKVVLFRTWTGKQVDDDETQRVLAKEANEKAKLKACQHNIICACCGGDKKKNNKEPEEEEPPIPEQRVETIQITPGQAFGTSGQQFNFGGAAAAAAAAEEARAFFLAQQQQQRNTQEKGNYQRYCSLRFSNKQQQQQQNQLLSGSERAKGKSFPACFRIPCG